MEQLDEINHKVWADNAGDFAADGWLDPAEPAALAYVASEVRGGRVLDLGVGAGRTTALLRLLTDDYLGLDYSQAMVDIARQRHPESEICLGDVRDLHDQASDSVALAVFSNNGLDSLSHPDRQRGLSEIGRVLRPGGLLVMSVLNKEGPLYRCVPGGVPATPWHSHLVQGHVQALQPSDDSPVAQGPEGFASAVRNWRALSKMSEDHADWGISPLPAYDFGLLAHFSTLGAAVDELAGHKLHVERAWACTSAQPLAHDCRSCDSWYFYFAARWAE
ncbi:MAG: ubiE/COQ5 methyltransferase family protein [Frankiales bacterium]|nr:ubiE/COQ5 methyltransferase family protein [Frankiales bacterium]